MDYFREKAAQGIVVNAKVEETDITDDSAILYFTLEEALPISLVMDMLEDDMELSLLYHGTSKDNAKLHHCCFFTANGKNMFKFNMVSDNREYVSDLTISIFDSLDTMESELESDLTSHAKSFDFIQAMEVSEVLGLFCLLE